jgi:hypothetical protein
MKVHLMGDEIPPGRSMAGRVIVLSTCKPYPPIPSKATMTTAVGTSLAEGGNHRERVPK